MRNRSNENLCPRYPGRQWKQMFTFKSNKFDMTKTVQHSIKNVSGNIEAVFLKLGTRNVHHKRNKMTAVMLLP